jgi:hypothetical protein
MPEHVCERDECNYEVASQTGQRPRSCPQCGGSLVRPADEYSAAVVAFAEKHGLDPAEVAAQRGETDV